MQAQEVYTNDRHRIMRFAPPPDSPGHRLLVSFEHGRNNMAGFEPPRCPNYATRLGMAVMVVQTARRDWYISPHTPALADALDRLTQPYADVTMTGFSMGGYAALLMSRAGRARRIMAVSPQFSIDPQIASFDPTRHEKFAKIGQSMPQPQEWGNPSVHGVLLYDPTIRADRSHAQLISQHFPNLSLIALPFGGHPATGAIADGGKVGKLSILAAEDQPDLQAIRNLHRLSRLKSGKYRLNLARAANRHHKDKAEQELVHIASSDRYPAAVRVNAAIHLVEAQNPKAHILLALLIKQIPYMPNIWIRRIQRAVAGS